MAENPTAGGGEVKLTPSTSPPPASSKKQARIDADTETHAQRGARGHYTSPREQFVYSKEELSSETLAENWGVKKARILKEQKRDKDRGHDWVKTREEYWRHVSDRVGEIIEKQTTDDVGSLAANYREVVSYVNSQLLDKGVKQKLTELKNADVSDFFKALNLMGRTAKSCVDVESSLPGAKFAQQLFDERMKDYEWFINIVTAFVRDPATLENIAKAIHARQVTQTLVTTGEYAEHIAYARSPDKDFKAIKKLAAQVGKKLEINKNTEEKQKEVEDDVDFDLE